jgi:hypothetical protein
MTFWQRKQRAHQLRALPLAQVLVWCGAQRDATDKNKWHTPRGVLSLSGAKFMNWSLGVGGGGALDLVMQLQGLDFKGAVDWLAHHSGQAWPEPVAAAAAPGALRLPAPDPRWLGQVRDYLVLERGIPAALLEPLIRAGTLYADGRANAVFLLRGQDNLPVGAELRGTRGGCWRGLAPGSRKDLGYFSVPAQARPGLILCESAIDALSCLALHPQHGCISTAGARPHPRWLGPLLAQGRQIACGFDRDAVGEAMAQAMIASHPAVQRLRPEANDWNDQLKARAGSAVRPAAPELSPAELLLLGKKNHESPADTGAGIDARVALPQSSILPNAERF